MECYQPIFVLHRDEKYYPIAISDYLRGCALYTQKKTCWGTQKVDTFVCDKLTPAYMASASANTTCVIRDSKIRYGDLACCELVCQVLQQNEYEYYQYVPFYGYNGPSKVMNCFEAGAHDADLEVVTCVVKDNIVQGYFLSQHGDQVWYWPHELKYENRYPIVYVARNSHAHYATSGDHERFGGLVVDECDADGVRWQPRELLCANSYDEDTMGFMQWGGNFGSTHVSSFASQSFWKGEYPPIPIPAVVHDLESGLP